MKNVDEFVRLAEDGELAQVEKMLAEGFDPDQQNRDGFAAIHIASREGKADVVRALLEAGASVNLRSELGLGTALFFAAYNGHLDIVKDLLDAGADASLRNGQNITPLQAASGQGQAYIVNVLLNATQDDLTRGWRKTGEDEVEHRYLSGARELTEVFNFASRERTTISRNPVTNAEAVAQQKFKDVAPEKLAEAAAQLVEKGGADHTASVGKNKAPLKLRG